MSYSPLQSMAKAQVLTFDTSVLVDEKEHRGMHAIRLQQIGNKKEHCIRFDVSLSLSLSLPLPLSPPYYHTHTTYVYMYIS